MRITIDTPTFALAHPFTITGHTFHSTDTLRVTLDDGAHRGVGESVGVYYSGDTAERMAAEVAAVADHIDDALDGALIQDLLPPAAPAMPWTALSGTSRRSARASASGTFCP
jgi:L-alanine-DL-glutamate epimerase-like enolase superfamily enzyme